jgi:uncharacterized protein YdhG (YjbR/CyaY superfamily)
MSDPAEGSFSKEERAAMAARARELKAEARAKQTRAAGERAVLEAIEAMSGRDKKIAQRLHAIITTAAPNLIPRTWYGMPAYANEAGRVVVFFRGAEKFKERYMTIGFNQEANLDEGNLWPVAYALTKLTPAEEKKIAELVKKALR